MGVFTKTPNVAQILQARLEPSIDIPSHLLAMYLVAREQYSRQIGADLNQFGGIETFFMDDGAWVHSIVNGRQSVDSHYFSSNIKKKSLTINIRTNNPREIRSNLETALEKCEDLRAKKVSYKHETENSGTLWSLPEQCHRNYGPIRTGSLVIESDVIKNTYAMWLGLEAHEIFRAAIQDTNASEHTPSMLLSFREHFGQTDFSLFLEDTRARVLIAKSCITGPGAIRVDYAGGTKNTEEKPYLSFERISGHFKERFKQ